jgi:hypothetical protein
MQVLFCALSFLSTLAIFAFSINHVRGLLTELWRETAAGAISRVSGAVTARRSSHCGLKTGIDELGQAPCLGAAVLDDTGCAPAQVA